MHIQSFPTSSYAVPLFMTSLTLWSGPHVMLSMTLRICIAMRALRAYIASSDMSKLAGRLEAVE